MKLPFTKMHGLGNDFVVIDATHHPFAPRSEQLTALADRHRGVGCDQILVIDPPPTGDPDADFGYRIYNADGSQVSQCGNGARCLARYVRDHGLSDKAVLCVRTRNATMHMEILDDGRVRVNMGVPRFKPADIPLKASDRACRYHAQLPDAKKLTFGAVSVGNPHAVIEVADTETAAVAQLGPALQQHTMFPEQVNVGFAQFVDRQHLRLRVYERGAGETQACGSGACAAVAVGRAWNLLDAHVSVELKGGTLAIDWAGKDDDLWMTGNATTVFEGSMQWAD